MKICLINLVCIGQKHFIYKFSWSKKVIVKKIKKLSQKGGNLFRNPLYL